MCLTKCPRNKNMHASRNVNVPTLNNVCDFTGSLIRCVRLRRRHAGKCRKVRVARNALTFRVLNIIRGNQIRCVILRRRFAAICCYLRSVESNTCTAGGHIQSHI